MLLNVANFIVGIRIGDESPSPWFSYHLFQVKVIASLCDSDNSRYSIASIDAQTKAIAT
jgi:hypothetical protein